MVSLAINSSWGRLIFLFEHQGFTAHLISYCMCLSFSKYWNLICLKVVFSLRWNKWVFKGHMFKFKCNLLRNNIFMQKLKKREREINIEVEQCTYIHKSEQLIMYYMRKWVISTLLCSVPLVPLHSTTPKGTSIPAISLRVSIAYNSKKWVRVIENKNKFFLFPNYGKWKQSYNGNLVILLN